LASATPPYPGGLEKEGSELLELPVASYRVPESEVRRIAKGLPISKEIRAIV
jgi:hypothetical protein